MDRATRCAIEKVRALVAVAGRMRLKLGVRRNPCATRSARGANMTLLLVPYDSSVAAGRGERDAVDEAMRDPTLRDLIANERRGSVPRKDRRGPFYMYVNGWSADPIHLPPELAACACPPRGRPLVQPRAACELGNHGRPTASRPPGGAAPAALAGRTRRRRRRAAA